jgi:iron complex outermembrane receptor protein
MQSFYASLKAVGFAGVSLMAIGSVPALAQETAPTTQPADPSAPQTTPSPAHAATTAPEAPAASSEVRDIVVTAQRRGENLQSVPITVSAFNAQDLTSNNVTSALDIGKLDTSVVVQAVDGNVLPFIRGVGTPLVTMGNESSIAVYLDGNYQTRLNPAILLLNNVERIEIIKGPQGTLFGRNASGGLINIITPDPTPGHLTEAKVSLGYGNYDTLYGSAYLSASLGSNAAFSLAGAYNNQQGGWGHDITTGGKAWFGLEEALRGKFTLDLDDRTRIRLSAFYARMKTDEGQQLQVQGQTQGWPVGSGLTGPVPPLPFFDTRNDLSNAFVTTNAGASVSFEHDFSFATLIETAAYNHTAENRPLDVDTTGLPAYNADFRDYTKQVTNELRLVSAHSSIFQWTAGLYYYQADQAYDPLSIRGFSLGLPPGAQVEIHSKLAVRSYAAYAQGTYQVAPKTDLTLGVRYTEDHDHGSGFQGLSVGGGPLGIFPGTSLDARAAFKNISWRAALDYHFTDAVMGYVSANRGFKSGTFNLVPFGVNPVKPEVLTAYEIGLKSKFWDNRARFNASAFYYDYRNAQVNTVPAPGILDIQNAPRARVYGLDLDGEVVPAKGLTLRSGVSLLSAKYTDFPDAAFFEAGPAPGFGIVGPFSRSAKGNYLSRAPKLTYNVGGEYIVPLRNEGSLNFSVNYAYTGRFFWDADNRVSQKAYGLLDAQIAYIFPNRKLAIRLWGSNLSNAHYYANEFESAGPQGSVGTPAAPRTFGIKFDWTL